MDEATRRGLIIGNCQGQQIAWILNCCPALANKIYFHYFANFGETDHLGHVSHLDDALCEKAVLHLNQIGSWGRVNDVEARLSPSCVTLHYPPVAFNALWPLRHRWPKQPPLKPRTIDLHIAYSDVIAGDIIKASPGKAEFLQRYAAADIRDFSDPARLLEIDSQWSANVVTHADLSFDDFVAANFRERRLTWALGHLTNVMYLEMVNGLVRELAARDVPPFASDRDSILRDVKAFLEGPEVHSGLNIPIHPQVADLLGLKWYRRDDLYWHEDVKWTQPEFVEYLYDYIAY